MYFQVWSPHRTRSTRIESCLTPLLKICPHEAVFPPFVNLSCFINTVGVLHLNSTNWLNFFTCNNLFILSSSTFMSLKDLRFFALLVLLRNVFRVLGLQVSVLYNDMGMFLIPLLLFDCICQLSPLIVLVTDLLQATF
jgi:hypothetical protein